MGDSILWKYWLWWALFASPAIPLVYAGRRLRAGPHVATAFDLVPLILGFVSSLWFDAVLANWHFLGPLYGRLHYVIIGGNLIVVFVCALLSLLASLSRVTRRQRLATALACLLLTLEWGRMGIINR